MAGSAPATAQVRLKLPDGSDYGYTGTIQFSEVIVEPTTGTVTLRHASPILIRSCCRACS